ESRRRKGRGFLAALAVTNPATQTTSANSQILRSVLKTDGIQVAVESAGAGLASFESEVEIVGEGMFVESGSIRYGDAGKVSFRTVGRGTLGPSPVAGVQRGAVMWEATRGEGRGGRRPVRS